MRRRDGRDRGARARGRRAARMRGARSRRSSPRGACRGRRRTLRRGLACAGARAQFASPGRVPLASRTMDAAQALADLTEISSQIEAAVLFDEAGAVQGSTLGDEEAAMVLAAAPRG